MLPVKIINDELIYSDWKLLGMDYLVTGIITKANNSLDINYEIYDVHKKEKFAAQRFLAYQIKSGNLDITPVMGFMNQLQELKVSLLPEFCM